MEMNTLMKKIRCHHTASISLYQCPVIIKCLPRSKRLYHRQVINIMVVDGDGVYPSRLIGVLSTTYIASSGCAMVPSRL